MTEAVTEALSDEENDAALRDDFYAFMLRCFRDLNAGANYLPSWHIEAMAAKLERVRVGGVRRLIINIPPRHLKSLAASIALPAWLLGHNPALSIVNVTYGQDLSDKFARDCRAVMTSEWYQMLFPTRLSSERPPFQELATTAGGFRLATSVGGALTGRGADVVIVDDPLKPSDALSESRRTGANEWFDATLYSRLNDKTKGAIVIVMQRLHEDDLVGHALKREDWDLLSFPAIAEGDEVHVVETIYGVKEYRRQAGEALHPGRESLETLGRIRTMLGEYNFAGQYQQRPAPSGGGMVKAAWFRRYARDERPAFDRIVQSWDTANKPSELADYSVCTTWGIKGADFYLLNVFRKRLSYPELKRAVAEQNALFRPQAILIEDKASGTQLVQELIRERMSHVKGVKPDGDKIMRLHARTAVIENGFVHLPDEAHWLADYLAELTAFPASRHDDQVDSTAQALAWASCRSSADEWIEYYRGPGEPDASKRVRVKAPEGCSHLQALYGGLLVVPNDRILELDEFDARAVLRSPGWMRA